MTRTDKNPNGEAVLSPRMQKAVQEMADAWTEANRKAASIKALQEQLRPRLRESLVLPLVDPPHRPEETLELDGHTAPHGHETRLVMCQHSQRGQR